ncbi:MAG: hypothetical protein ABWK53_10765 [Anaerolineales bacterium]
MRKNLSVLGKILAGLSAFAFIAAALLALLATGIDRRLLDANLYIEALRQLQAYERLPRIFAEQIVLSANYNPCSENPLLCENASPEFMACARRTLGEERYQVLSSGEAYPSRSELQLLQPCIQQYGASLTAPAVNVGPGENPLPTAPSQVQDCARQALGDEAYEAIVAEQRLSTDQEREQIAACFRQAGLAVTTEPTPRYLRNLTVTNWEDILRTIMPPEELQRIIEDAIGQTFRYLNSQQTQVSLPMESVKQRIVGPEGLNALLAIIRAQPPCSQAETQALERLVAGYSGQVSLCRPSEDLLNRMHPILEDQLQLIANQIPDRVQILGGDSAGGDSAAPRPGLRLVRLGMRLSPDLPLLFLLIVTLLAVRTPKSWLRWWGIPMFLAGLFAMILAATLAAIFEQTWVLALTSNLPPYLSVSLAELGHDFAGYIIHSLLEEIALSGVILGALGLAAWIGSYFVRLDEQGVSLALPVPK